MTRRDPEQPRPEGRGIAQLVALPPGGDQRVDDDLLRIGVRSEDQIGDALDPAPVRDQQLIDRLGPSVAQIPGEPLVQA